MVGASLPIIIVIPSALHSSSARSMVGRYPLRSDRKASAGSRASLATSCPLSPRLDSSLSMRCCRRSVADRLILVLFPVNSIHPLRCVDSVDRHLIPVALTGVSWESFPRPAQQLFRFRLERASTLAASWRCRGPFR